MCLDELRSPGPKIASWPEKIKLIVGVVVVINNNRLDLRTGLIRLVMASPRLALGIEFVVGMVPVFLSGTLGVGPKVWPGKRQGKKSVKSLYSGLRQGNLQLAVEPECPKGCCQGRIGLQSFPLPWSSLW